MKKIFLPILLASSVISTSASAYERFPLMIPNEAFTFNFNVRMFEMSRMKQEKILAALELIRYVLSTDEFRQGVLKHSYNGRRKFAYNKGLTNTQIYKKILMGAEYLHPYNNNTMDLEVELYTNKKSKTVGYTKTRSFRIWMNTKYFNERSSAEIAGTIVHEWLHKLGFAHEVEASPFRKYSVPYAIGKLIRNLAEEAGGTAE
ncbi:MAG TPA: hypothetical protein VNJ08_07875 [Bacteriovoracaceae bacterium]|nr:hypothetical protein [Bacteriovoracaceae bacterium]